jgi:hypothetical protein
MPRKSKERSVPGTGISRKHRLAGISEKKACTLAHGNHEQKRRRHLFQIDHLLNQLHICLNMKNPVNDCSQWRSSARSESANDPAKIQQGVLEMFGLFAYSHE